MIGLGGEPFSRLDKISTITIRKPHYFIDQTPHHTTVARHKQKMLIQTTLALLLAWTGTWVETATQRTAYSDLSGPNSTQLYALPTFDFTDTWHIASGQVNSWHLTLNVWLNSNLHISAVPDSCAHDL
jgi:hypothetical protein